MKKLLIPLFLITSCGTPVNNSEMDNTHNGGIISTPMGRSPINPIPQDPIQGVISDALWEGTGEYESFY